MPPPDGFARAKGARLAGCRPWELRVDRLRPPTGAYLDIRYASFAEHGPPRFARPANLYKLECDQENPILWLNLDHDRVCEVLDSVANVGTRARIRDAVFDYVSHNVWSRLFLLAAHDSVDTEDPPYDWEQSVLERFLPVLYPEYADHQSRVVALSEELQQGDQNQILGRLDTFLQEHLEIARHMTWLVEETD